MSPEGETFFFRGGSSGADSTGGGHVQGRLSLPETERCCVFSVAGDGPAVCAAGALRVRMLLAGALEDSGSLRRPGEA